MDSSGRSLIVGEVAARKTPVWLVEMYRQWMAARGSRVKPHIRSFRRDWEDLLKDSGITRAEDRQAAQSEAEKEEAQGNLRLHRLRNRPYIVRRIELLPSAESWLLRMMNRQSPNELLAQSLNAVTDAAAMGHSRFPLLWKEWCGKLAHAFRSGKNVRPLYWQSPETMQALLNIVHSLTSREWQEDAMIREVSVAIGLDSKGLERQRRRIEACLTQMFCRPMSLQALGLVLSDSRVDLSGILTLHYLDSEPQVFSELKAVFTLSLHDLERAQFATTPALRLLTVENSKTTLRRLTSANVTGDTLLAGCAFPTKALLRLMDLLPENLPVFHFGDTDPAGFHILSKLRECSKKCVRPFLMERRTVEKPKPLT